MKRRICKAAVSIILTLVLVLPLFPAGGLSVYAEGDGSEAHPYLIRDLEDLEYLYEAILAGETEGVRYKLTQDLRLVFNTMLGDEDHPFEGVFDGGGHTITGMYVSGDSSEGRTHGFFRFNRGTVRNLTVDGTITAHSDAALVVGENAAGGVIENCRAVGRVESEQTGGGVAARNYGELIGCVNEATVVSTGTGGGVCGYSGGKETGCVNLADVTCMNKVGGIVGQHTAAGAIENCANHGTIRGYSCAGGISGETNCTVRNCVNRADVSVGGYYAGGITGSNFKIVSNCVNYGNVSATENMAGGISGFSRAGAEGCENHGDVSASYEAGGVVGYTNSKITYCCNTGSVTADGKWAGGIAADSGGANEFHYCFNVGTVSGGELVGGLVGDMNNALMDHCYNTANVTATGEIAGGLVGLYGVGDINDCRSDGSVRASKKAGGIVGSIESGGISRCLFTGRVNAGDYAGTIIGERQSVSLVRLSRNHYYLYSGHPSGIGEWDTDEYQNEEIKGLTEDQYKHGDEDVAYIDWDFDGDWYMTDNGPRPDGIRTVSENGVVVIASAEDFIHFRDSVNLWSMTYHGVTVKLANDIDLSDVPDQVPVGYPALGEYNCFSGRFNGEYHTVSGVNISAGNCAGLFGKADGSVTALTVKGTVSGGKTTGGIAGEFGGEMSSCVFEGTVSGKGSVGGLVGYASQCTVSDSVMRGSVSGTAANGESCVGGIVGECAGNCDIQSCEANVDVTGADTAGGIAGSLGSFSTVGNCSHVGAVRGSGSVGGVAGRIGTTSDVTYSYHYTGRVSGGTDTGGVIGYLGAVSARGVTNCYYLKGTVYNADGAQTDRGIGGALMSIISGDVEDAAEPLSAAEFSAQSSFRNWDFRNLWCMSAERPELRRTHSIVTFDANGGSGSMDPVFFGKTGGRLPNVGFYRTNWDFYGWNTSPDNSGDFYRNAGMFEGLRDVTLYAIWLERTSAAYISEYGTEATASCYVFPTDLVVIPGGWYCASGNVVRTDRFTFDGEVLLILADGCTLTAGAGVRLTGEDSLTVYGQNSGTGKLIASGAADCAGIGGSKGEPGGVLTVYGGVIEATGGNYGAGIGGGDTGKGGIVTVRGGAVTATGSEGAAGIGGGDYGNGGTVLITGGVVNAYGSVRSKTGQASPGIGAGRPKNDGSEPRDPGFCTILGGAVTAEAGPCEAQSAIGAQAIGVNFADVGAVSDPGGAERLVLGDDIYAIAGWTSSGALPMGYLSRVYGCQHYPCARLGVYDRYDLNRDVSVSISDVSALLDLLAETSVYNAFYDLNGDGTVSISDVSALLDYLSVL